MTKNPLMKKLDFALAKYAKKKTAQAGIPRAQNIMHAFKMSRGKIDISRLVLDKDEL